MTERPIPFSAEMVLAILAGRKTQTRRVMKVQPPADAVVTVEHYFPIVSNRRGEDWYGPEIFGAHWQDDEKGLRCPYGAPGDLLWVREAWRAWSQYDDLPPSRIPPGVDVQYIADARTPWISRYRSPRFMPRWASRITLRITDVRVERLQDISEDDARAEGATMRPSCNGFQHRYPGWRMDWSEVGKPSYFATGAQRGKKAPLTESDVSLGSAKWAFASFWTSINGPGAWEANSWVWVLSFERVKP